MTDENKNIENNREENQNKTKCNKKWWKKLLVLASTYGLVFVTLISIIVFYVNQPRLKIPRYNHSAVVLNDGKILITGGETKYSGEVVILDTAEIYDPKNNKVELIKAKMNSKRTTHASVLLPNGDVLIIGGDKDKKSIEIYRTKEQKFEFLTQMKEEKYYVRAALIDDSRVLIIDGYTNNLDLYDIKHNILRNISKPKRSVREKVNFITIGSNVFFAVGAIKTSPHSEESNDTVMYVYDINKNKLKEIQKKQSGYDKNICVYNSIFSIKDILVHVCSSPRSIYAEKYDILTDKFYDRTNFIDSYMYQKGYQPINIIGQDRVLLLGSYNIIDYFDFNLFYDLRTNSISLIKSKKYKSYSYRNSISNINNKVIFIGGFYNIGGIKKISNRIKIINIGESK